jgi:ribosomal protein S12 methylthiotransferase accessory factor
MEAFERVCGEEAPAGCRATFAALAGAVDPARFDLPFDSVYTPDREIAWLPAYDLMHDEQRWVARDLVVTPAVEGVSRGVETNGLASGNSILEATLHALLEVIERDASSREDYYAANHDPAEDHRPTARVDPDSLPAALRSYYDRLVAAGLTVSLLDITSDLDVPVYAALIADADFPGARGEILYFVGVGADEDPERAAIRALTEVTQAHSVVLLGARDAFEGLTDRIRAATIARQADRVFGPPTVRWRERALPPEPRGLDGALQRLVERLRLAGFEHCLVADLTRADLGVPVVRVLVPGLAAPYGDTTRRPNQRLFETLA